MSKEFWTDGTGSLLVAVLIALTIRWAFLEAYVIPSESMLPSLLVNDHIFVNKAVYGTRIPFTEKWLYRLKEPERGEVIVFKFPEDKSLAYIKRVVGVPGDKIHYENGNLYVNGELVEKTLPSKLLNDFDWIAKNVDHLGNQYKDVYTHWQEQLGGHDYSVLQKKMNGNSFEYGPVTVPADNYLVLGDNRDNSSDSRAWGFVPRENLIGRAGIVWMSCDEKLPGPWPINIFCNPLEMRWSRFFHNVQG